MVIKTPRCILDMLSFANRPKVYFGGSLVGQNSDLNRSKEFSLGKNILSMPFAVGTWLDEGQKGLRKTE
jgi:hypothetical protein